MIKQFVRKFVPEGLLNLIYHLPLAIGASLYYGFPARKLKVIGITGSDGKTTTATLIYKILTDSGKKTALISTVAAKIGNQEIPTGLHVTSPDPWVLQKIIKSIADQDYEYLVLEVTSHGLAQYRVFGIRFLIGVITNITHEHLDYHKTMLHYQKAKSKLFEHIKYAILNADDSSYSFLKSRINPQIKIITYAIKTKANFTPMNFSFKTQLPGEYNIYNCLAAIATTMMLKIDKKQILSSVNNFTGVEGRMEEINEGQKFRIVVDFAHTPNALENTLNTFNSQLFKGSRLIAVFGCAGLRDQLKRPLMGQIATRIADISIFTAEDPRTENLDKIIDQMVVGAKKGGAIEFKNFANNNSHTYLRVPDRYQAIEYAVNMAHKGDIIGIFGKGHEQSMCFGTTEYPWDDRKKAREILRSYLKNAAKK